MSNVNQKSSMEDQVVESQIKKLRENFETVYPELSASLKSAKSQQEIDQIRHNYVKENFDVLPNPFNEPIEHVYPGDQSVNWNTLMLLSHEKAFKLFSARGHQIIELLLEMLHQIQSVRNNNSSEGELVQYLSDSGLLAIGPYYENALVEQENVSRIRDMVTQQLVKFLFMFAGPEGVVATVVATFVADIIIPLIHFMEKPAAAIILVINASDRKMEFALASAKHGKMIAGAKSIPGAITVKKDKKGDETETLYSAGLFVFGKDKDALYGTQAGFSLIQQESNIAFQIGEMVPMIGDNASLLTGVPAIPPEMLQDQTDSCAEEVAHVGGQISGSCQFGGLSWSMTINGGAPRPPYGFYVALIKG